MTRRSHHGLQSFTIVLLKVIVDFMLFNAGFLLAFYFRQNINLEWIPFYMPEHLDIVHTFEVYSKVSLMFSLINLVLFSNYGLYQRRQIVARLDELYLVFKAITIGAIITLAFSFLFREVTYSRFVVLVAWALTIVLVDLWRIILRKIQGLMVRRGIGVARVLIYGAGKAGLQVARELTNHIEFGYQVIGFVDDDPNKLAKEYLELNLIGNVESVPVGREVVSVRSNGNKAQSTQTVEPVGIKVLGNGNDLFDLIKRYEIDEVILAIPSAAREKIMDLILALRRRNIIYRIMPDLFELLTIRVNVSNFGSVALLDFVGTRLHGWRLLFKRLIDIVGSSFLIFLLSPFFLMVGIWIKLDSRGPVFFRQTRLGINGKPFRMFKFRSMIADAENLKDKLTALNEADGPLFKIKDDPRVTRVGRFLRRTSLDELPQLFNVFLGDMSLVGPRPPLPEETEDYNDWHRKRLEVPQGMTGLWQVSGRSSLSFEEMVALDVYYIENWTFWLDFKIILKTLPIVLLRRGAY
jgi:Undecaprenyl-phosphate glucose phosphotransferase